MVNLNLEYSSTEKIVKFLHIYTHTHKINIIVAQITPLPRSESITNC